MKDPFLLLPFGIIATIVWIFSDELFKKRMSLLSTDKKRKNYEGFLSNWNIRFREKDDFFVRSIISLLSGFIFLVLIAIVVGLIDWVIDFDSIQSFSKYAMFFPIVFAVFLFRTSMSRNTYLEKISSTQRQKLQDFKSHLTNYQIKIEKKVHQHELEISKINAVIQENDITNHTKNEIDKEITKLQLEIVKNKKVLNDINSISNRISIYLSWEMWLFKQIEQRLDIESQEKLNAQYELTNVYHPDFFDMLIDYNRFSYILGKIKYVDLIRELKYKNVDFADFKQKEYFHVIERDFNSIISQCKSVLP